MTRLIHGPRIGRTGALRTGCSATLFSPDRTRLFLTLRTDNHLWCLPGGGMDPGETLAEACEREMFEETGLRVRVIRLIGVYSDPNIILEYRDGNRFQIVACNFEVEPVGGEPGLSNEVEAFGYFSLEEIAALDLMEHQRVRIQDAFSGQAEASIR
jgi:8-oxo-dGTP pyrophosphatase MutT (NUDIX family)